MVSPDFVVGWMWSARGGRSSTVRRTMAPAPTSQATFQSRRYRPAGMGGSGQVAFDPLVAKWTGPAPSPSVVAPPFVLAVLPSSSTGVMIRVGRVFSGAAGVWFSGLVSWA